MIRTAICERLLFITGLGCYSKFLKLGGVGSNEAMKQVMTIKICRIRDSRRQTVRQIPRLFISGSKRTETK